MPEEKVVPILLEEMHGPSQIYIDTERMMVVADGQDIFEATEVEVILWEEIERLRKESKQ